MSIWINKENRVIGKTNYITREGNKITFFIANTQPLIEETVEYDTPERAEEVLIDIAKRIDELEKSHFTNEVYKMPKK